MSIDTVSTEVYIPRHVESRVAAALADTRIVAIVGPRQSGKTTLARRIAVKNDLGFASLDSRVARLFAASDPEGFLKTYPVSVIDEIQRAPELILELKRRVDEDARPGRYLVTGSVDLFAGTIVPDSLAGRVETVELLPFSQAEARRLGTADFLNRACAGDFSSQQHTGFTQNLLDAIVTGGYPEIMSVKGMRRKQERLLAYTRIVAGRDLPELMSIRKDRAAMFALVEHAALMSGQLVNLSSLAASLKVDHKTVDRWLSLLERMFLVRRIRAWNRNQGKRLIRTPKLHFVDSGVLAAVRGVDEEALQADRQQLGFLLESFVFSELIKALPHCRHPLRISHYRDKDGYEVDFVLETSSGKIVGLEVKAAAGVNLRDFRGLRRLAAASGDKFVCGIVLHDGDQIMQTGRNLFAMPVKMLWEG